MSGLFHCSHPYKNTTIMTSPLFKNTMIHEWHIPLLFSIFQHSGVAAITPAIIAPVRRRRRTIAASNECWIPACFLSHL